MPARGPLISAEPGDERSLLSQLKQLVSGYSLNREDGELSARRKKIQRFHNGELYGSEAEQQNRPGRSRVVTRDVLQTVRWSLPWVVRSCLTGRPCSFRAVGGTDDQAEDETDAVFHALRSAPCSFQELWNYAYSTLLMPNAYLKVWWDDTPDNQIMRVLGKSGEELAMVDMDPNARILEAAPHFDKGRQAEVPGLFDATILITQMTPQLRIQSVPEEQMLVAASATTLDLDQVPWVCHAPTNVTVNELVQMGVPREAAEDLPMADIEIWKSERQTRASTEDELRVPNAPLPGMEYKQIWDWYGFVDFDGDGYTERRRILFGDSDILINEYIDQQPFVSASSNPQPHRHVGMSQAEPAMPWQRIISELSRQGLTNLYRINARRAAVSRGADIDEEEYRDVDEDGYYQVDGDARAAVAYEQVPNVFPATEAGLRYAQEQLAADTGVNRMATGLDAKTLAASTMGAYLEAAGQASAVLESVVRCFAEHGMVGACRKIHGLLRTRATGQYEYEIDGEWRSTSPSAWVKRTEMDVSVGTGTGTPSEKIAANLAVLEKQEQYIAHGGSTKKLIHNTLEDLCAQLGKSVTRHFLDPESPEAQQMAQREAEQRQAELERLERTAAAQERLAKAALVLQAQKQATDRAKVAADVESAIDEAQRKWAELEYDQQVDVEGKGLERPSLRAVNTDA